jgi:phage terminase large subunit GpA-like protein
VTVAFVESDALQEFRKGWTRAFRGEIANVAGQVFSERTKLTLSQWSDEHRRLPKANSAEPGPFRTSRLPYLKAIMDALTNPRVRKVVVCKGSQVGASTVGENWLGYSMHHDPAAMLALWPTEKLLRRWSLTRLDPLIEETPVIRALFDRTGMRDSGDSIAHKEVPGMTFDALTAKSTADMRSISAPRLIIEEVDEIDAEIGEQGDPIELMRRALRTFFDSKEYLVSTPVTEGRSRIWKELQDSTWFEWHWPCPHCGTMQVPRWRDGHRDSDDASGAYRFTWEKDASEYPIPGTVCYTCVDCSSAIEESWKVRMLEGGDWVARNPEHRTLGFHIPALISPLISWDTIAEDFYKARKDKAKMQVVVNTHFGLPYRDKGESLSPHRIMRRAHPYEADVPDGVRLITVACDVQGAGDGAVHIAWLGWGAGLEAWVLRWEIIEMDDLVRQTWPGLFRAVGAVISKPMMDRQGKERYPAAGVIDGRFQSVEVRRWTNAYRLPNGRRMLAIAGVQGRSRPILESETQQKTRRRTSAKKPLRSAAVDIVKDLMAARLQIEDPGPGYVHHPDTINPSWYDGLTAEETHSEYRNGQWYRKWDKKAPDLMNEPWDLLVYNYISLHSLGPSVHKELEDMVRDEVGHGAQSGRQAGKSKRRQPRVVSKGVY